MVTGSPRSAARILVDALLTHGADLAFCVPGESYLPVLDALGDVRERLRLVVCRQEGGAAYMAEAYGKLTGRPGICLVTRGPGATNASIGVHLAQQDSTPMILFVGQVGNDVVEREAFQEIDYRRMFGTMTKWVAQIDRADRIPEYISHAFHVATAGRAGPVVLALPEDMLAQEATVADTPPYRAVQPHPGPEQMAELHRLLSAAARPFVILGGSGWDAEARDRMAAFAAAARLPVGCAFRNQDLFDNGRPNYAGDVGLGINPKLAQRIRESDLVVAVGARLGEMTTGGYTLLEPPVSRQKLVHVHASADEPGRVYHPTLAINAGMRQFAAALPTMPPIDGSRWAAATEVANADYRANMQPGTMPGPVDLAEVVAVLRRHIPVDSIITTGAGNYTGWVQRFYPFTHYRTQLAPTNGSMGYGVPAAVAAKLTHPDRTVVSVSGDGCFLMNGQELATALANGLRILFIVVNNGMYGTIRMHQERDFPSRVYGTDLRNPDFAALARAYQMHGEVVESTAAFAPALTRALAHDGPALIELRIDPDAITTRTTLGAIRANALSSRRS